MCAQVCTGLILASVLTVSPGCASTPAPAERAARAQALADAKGWRLVRVPAQPFELVVFMPAKPSQTGELTVYVEGDGFAWITRSIPSPDPTPLAPVALQMALAHPGGQAAYLARPCQFVDAQATGCDKRYWTAGRYAAEVVEAMDHALDVLKHRFGAARLILVGHSGGATIAALLTARRDDVTRLVTVAGNLDHQAWTAHHRVPDLSGSLNPAREATRLANVRQRHFIGQEDRVVPPELAKRWPKAITGAEQSNLIVVEGFGHACCWADHWAELWTELFEK